MFSKISRYRKLPDIITVDVQRRQLASRELRLFPKVSGTFRHTINAGDRLDQLAYKYYDQPRKWWRICDANPQFLSPLALVGQEAIVTLRFALTVSSGGDPLWADLFVKLRAIPGVEDVSIEEDVAQVPVEQNNGKKVTLWMDQFSRAVLVTYNRLQVNPKDLKKAINDVGFVTGEQVALGQLGQPIVIPPDVIG